MELGKIVLLCVCMLFMVSCVYGNALFRVKHKFKGRDETTSLRELRSHDARRHGRMLDSIDIPLGGNGLPTDAGLYFTKIQIGYPAREYHVQVDTGSDILWVNCAGCDNCPKKSELGIKLAFYDPKGSATADLVTCDDKQCRMIYGEPLSGCESDMLCQYEVTYGDGSQTAGYFVQDYFHYKKVSGNMEYGNGSIVFGARFRPKSGLTEEKEEEGGLTNLGGAPAVLSVVGGVRIWWPPSQIWWFVVLGGRIGAQVSRSGGIRPDLVFFGLGDEDPVVAVVVVKSTKDGSPVVALSEIDEVVEIGGSRRQSGGVRRRVRIAGERKRRRRERDREDAERETELKF